MRENRNASSNTLYLNLLLVGTTSNPAFPEMRYLWYIGVFGWRYNGPVSLMPQAADSKSFILRTGILRKATTRKIDVVRGAKTVGKLLYNEHVHSGSSLISGYWKAAAASRDIIPSDGLPASFLEAL